MKDTVAQQATSILAGVRDNLLKPMAAEIEGLQQENQDAVLKCFAEQTKIFCEQMSTLQNNVAELKEQIKALNEQFIDASTKVKWNE